MSNNLIDLIDLEDVNFDADAVLARYSSSPYSDSGSSSSSFVFLYIICIVLGLLLVLFVFIKIKYPFWNVLPVHHSYDFWRTWTKTPFIIRRNYPKKTKYCDLLQVQSFDYSEDTNANANVNGRWKYEVLDLLQGFYLKDADSLFLVHHENLDAYHTGYSLACCVSVYKAVNDPLILGCLFSRPVVMHFFGVGGGGAGDLNRLSMSVHFLDFACSRSHVETTRSIEISRKLLETHCYRLLSKSAANSLLRVTGRGGSGSNHHNKSVEASDSIYSFVFRKEGEPHSGICPFLTFQTQLFALSISQLNSIMIHHVLPFSFRSVFLQSNNVHLFSEVLEDIMDRFGVVGVTSVGNLEQLIRKRILFVCCILKTDSSRVFCMYVFRDSRISMENYVDQTNGSILNFIASFQQSNSNELFLRGFLHALRDIVVSVPAFRLLSFEEISHNGLLLEDVSQLFHLIFESGSSVNYYAYNAVFPTMGSRDVFFVF